MLKKEDINALNWAKAGDLMPAIVQDACSGQVLMLGFMNREAVDKTLESGKVTFWSRTKRRLWTKGETSEHWLHLVDIGTDCDRDSLLILANPNLESRRGASPEESYTARLYAAGTKRIAQKVGEEGVETALAATVHDKEELKNEAADLVYHLLVLLADADLELADVIDVLKARHKDRQREHLLKC